MRLAYIDGWRVIAITLVLLDHLSMNRTIGAFYEASPFGVLSQYGETGVYLFFFISGYVVSLTCLREVATTGGFSTPAFYARRFFRIVPPLMLYLAACLALGAARLIDFGPENFLSAALYLCNTTAPLVSCGWYVGHTWSLAFEEQFYWLFPLVFAWAQLGRRPRPLLLGLAALFALAPFVFTIWWIGKIGCVIAYVLFFAGYVAARRGENAPAPWAGRETLALVAAAAIVFMPRSVVAFFGADEAAKAELIAWYRLLYVAAIPVLILVSGRAGSRLAGALSWAPLAHLGRASYSIYLWQQLCNSALFEGLGVAQQFALLAAMAGFCLLLFRLELKTIGVGHALSKRLQGRAGAAAPLGDAAPAR